MDTSDAMLGRFFAVKIRPEHRQEFLEASLFGAQSAISEERDVFQFHFMEDASRSNRFYFYEVYRDESALHTHWETEVFKTWWAKIQHMLDGEVKTIAQMHSLFPTSKGFEAQKPGLLQW
ncbi:putative quinol monooxygenase [Roseovarius sp. D22-M7]|uniref:putative quinol monooxygenase n=1 Tax=Roseovarius sp. D22-M7 TaxID=3127116 RepID=UPI00300FFD34